MRGGKGDYLLLTPKPQKSSQSLPLSLVVMSLVIVGQKVKTILKRGIRLVLIFTNIFRTSHINDLKEHAHPFRERCVPFYDILGTVVNQVCDPAKIC